jgi:hypothetical protein
MFGAHNSSQEPDMTRSITAAILLALSASLMTPVSSEAQLGGLIKRKVKEAVKKPERPAKTDDTPASAPTAPSAPSGSAKKNDDPTGFGSAIIEITQATVDDLMDAMQKEIDMQAVLKKEIARYGTHDQYEACKVRVAQSSEGKKTMDRMYNPPKNVTAEEYMAIQKKVVEDMDALTLKGCPLNPGYWSPGRISESADSIHIKAAESLGDGSLTAHLYAVALERIERLCQYKGLGIGGVATTTVDTLKRKDSLTSPVKAGPFQFPGIGKDIYWMYTGTEVAAVTHDTCRRYYALAGKLMK